MHGASAQAARKRRGLFKFTSWCESACVSALSILNVQVRQLGPTSHHTTPLREKKKKTTRVTSTAAHREMISDFVETMGEFFSS